MIIEQNLIQVNKGFEDRFDSAGVSRFYVELFNLVKTPADAAGANGSIVDRDPDILMGPAVPETL